MKTRPKATQRPRGTGIVKLVTDLVQVKQMRKMWDDKEKALRDQLMSVIEDTGETDDKGHQRLQLAEEVGGISEIVRQRRVSQVLNADIAEVELKKLKLWKQCTQEVTVIDEDAILALAFEGKIPEAVMKRIVEERVNFALMLQ